MKQILSLVSIFCFFTFAKCNKDRIDSNGLPPATQEGKNTFGFLLNGQPWKPQGVRGTGNLSIDFDPNFNKGIFNIVAYNFIPTISEQVALGIRDSLNLMNAPFTLNLNNNSLYVISYTKTCDYFSKFSNVASTGTLNISKLDRTNHIISGTFNATLSKAGCDTIKITEGRFDMKF